MFMLLPSFIRLAPSFLSLQTLIVKLLNPNQHRRSHDEPPHIATRRRSRRHPLTFQLRCVWTNSIYDTTTLATVATHRVLNCHDVQTS